MVRTSTKAIIFMHFVPKIFICVCETEVKLDGVLVNEDQKDNLTF